MFTSHILNGNIIIIMNIVKKPHIITHMHVYSMCHVSSNQLDQETRVKWQTKAEK